MAKDGGEGEEEGSQINLVSYRTKCLSLYKLSYVVDLHPGKEMLPYIDYTGMCRCAGYGFQALIQCQEQGIESTMFWVRNKVSNFSKLKDSQKVLSIS